MISIPYALAFAALCVLTTWFCARLGRNGGSCDDTGDTTPPPRRGQAWERATTRECDYGRVTLAPRDRENV